MPEQNQKIFFLKFKPNNKNKIEINEKIKAWWSINGVPVCGYARIPMDREYKNEYSTSKLFLQKK